MANNAFEILTMTFGLEDLVEVAPVQTTGTTEEVLVLAVDIRL